MRNIIRFRPFLLAAVKSKQMPLYRYSVRMMRPLAYGFSEFKESPIKEALKANQQLVVQTVVVGEEEVDFVHTKGSISILDKVPGVKCESGDLYVLSFTCNQCQTRSIRSFTKHSYHKGVVLVRCGGCQSIHLVADNIGWFDQKPSNIETMHQGKVQKVKDPVAIAKFLNKAFSQDKQLFEEQKKVVVQSQQKEYKK